MQLLSLFPKSSLNWPFPVLALLLLISNTGISLYAQSINGQISGTVVDFTGGVVRGAHVRIANPDTKTDRETKTDNTGNFRVSNLNAGEYMITISAPGFAEAERKNIQLLAREQLRFDIALTIASAPSQVVKVQATDALVSDANTISYSRSGQEISDLALNFRATDKPSPLNVAALTPNVQQDRTGQISVTGGMPYFTSFSIDGVSTANVRFNGPNADLFPSLEGIEEFRVNTTNNNAEFGQPSDITVTSRGGTSHYHGAIYDFYQNSALNAGDSFTHAKDFLISNTFGSYIGGPLRLPKIDEAKNKTFFFFDYEGMRLRRSKQVKEFVPPAAWRNGDLSSLLDPATAPNGMAIQLFNPYTNAPIANNQITPDPTAIRILNNLYPQQNVPGSRTNVSQPNFITTIPGPYTLNSYDGRIDQSFTPSHKVFSRITWKDISDKGVSPYISTTNGYNANLGQFALSSELRNLAASYNWIINAHLVNELRGGFSIANYTTSYPLAAQGNAIIQRLGLSGLPPSPKLGGIPNFNFTASGLASSNNAGRPRILKNHTYVLSDNLTWLKGPHIFKFGVDYSHLSFVDFLSFFSGDEFGEYYFTGALTADKSSAVANSGFDFADFLFGLPTVTAFAQNGPDTRPYANQYAFYAQDEWKVSSRLSLTFGLRYEIHPPFNDKTNQLANFDRFTPGGRVVVQNQKSLDQVAPTFAASIGKTPIVLATAAGLPETLRHTYYGDWDPRFGLAWRPFHNSKTVIRAAIGVYTVPVLGSVLYSLAGVATSNTPVFLQEPSVTQTGITYSLQFPNVFPIGAGGVAGIPDFRSANQIDLKDPRSIQWSFAVERDIGWKTLLRFSYVGTHTTSLIHSPDLNQVKPNTIGYTPEIAATRPFANFNAVLTRENGPSAKYNTGAIEVVRRFAAGLNFQSSYAWAKNLSNALGPAPDAFSAENGPTTLNRFDIAADYGNVVFTRRHRFLTTFSWEVPIGHGRHYLNGGRNSAANAVLGGWTVAGIFLVQSGPYLTPTFSGADPSGTGVLVRGVTSTQRPDCIGKPSLSNIDAYAIPNNNIGRFGNCGVGILEGPGAIVFSATLGKQLKFTEQLGLKFEAQFANLFNHLNPDIPSTNVSSSSYGKFNAGQQGDQAGPRTIQFGLRLFF